MDSCTPCVLTSVTRRFGGTTALDSVDFEMRRGEVVALLGPNGAGKTTLVRVALGLIRPTSGDALLWGLAPHDPAARRRVGVMLQVGRVPETLTVREHVHLFSSYYGIPQPVEVTLDRAGVHDIADVRFGELSGGQRQRALFALAICGTPELLVLDEPTVGLDVEARRSFWCLVRGMIDRGASVMLTTHYLEEADTVSDRVVVLNHGRIVADGEPEDIKRRVAARTVRCKTVVPADMVRALPTVQSVAREKNALTILTTDAECLVRELLSRDPGLRDLEITSAGLEEAFIALTGANHPNGGADLQVGPTKRSEHVAGVRA